jgi:hypothetical protein
MPSKTKPKPPAAPPIKATRKALLAYHSELKKYHKKLQEWEDLLCQRNEELMEAKDEFEAMMEDDWPFEEDDEDEKEGECSKQDVTDDCKCDTCESWRVAAGFNLRTNEPRSKKPALAGDEVKWLESLFKLKDKRPVQKH